MGDKMNIKNNLYSGLVDLIRIKNGNRSTISMVTQSVRCI